MRLFRRIGDIIAANLNDLVDRFEDPEVMLKQAIREMEAMIDDATAAAARAIAGERLLARDLSGHREKARHWTARAEEAVRNGDDDLGRQAISRSLEHQAMLNALTEQQSSANRNAQALRGQIEAMRAKQAEARRKLASLSARRQTAKAERALQGSMSDSSLSGNGFARFERMAQQIDLADAEAQALTELYEPPDSRLESGAESREQAQRIETELAAIKERVRTAQNVQ
jgi:phage shock protein A